MDDKKSKVPWLKILAVIMCFVTLGSVIYLICAFPIEEEVDDIGYVILTDYVRRLFMPVVICLGATAYLTKKFGWERFSKILAVVMCIVTSASMIYFIGFFHGKRI